MCVCTRERERMYTYVLHTYIMIGACTYIMIGACTYRSMIGACTYTAVRVQVRDFAFVSE